MLKPTVVFSPLRHAVPAQGGSMDLLLRIQAPERPANLEVPYAPKRLALVVDRSGSMSGEPLDEALKCVQHIATHLTSRDELSIVVYDTKVDVLMPLGPVVSQSAIQSAIRHVLSGGSTNLHGGWLEGARQLESGIDNSISRVILLSDGRLNAGLRDELKIQEQCSAWQTKGVTTTTVGLGRGFNEDLMVGMAQAGGGQNYYGQQAEDLFDNFDEELSLLQAMYMQKLSVKLIPAPGVIIEMLSMTKPDAAGAYPLSDLAWDAESWLAVRLHLSPCAPGTSRELLALTLTGQGVDGKQFEMSVAPFQLEALVEENFEALPIDDLVARRLDEVRFAVVSNQLRTLAKTGQKNAARALLKEFEEEFSHNSWLMAKIGQLQRLVEMDMEMVSKEVMYSSSRMSRRLASKNEMAFFVDETNTDIPAFLRKKESEGRGRTRP